VGLRRVTLADAWQLADFMAPEQAMNVSGWNAAL
jgi:hypothetical protein